jgi:hypothetical protein
MTPRRFINQLRSPTGLLLLFLLGLAVILIMVNSHRGSSNHPSAPAATPKPANQQLPQSVLNAIAPFNPPQPSDKPTPAFSSLPARQSGTTPALPPLTLFAETPPQQKQETKKFSSEFAPFGRLISCELVITVDSSSINTPIVGLVTEDVFHHGQLIIPAGTEVHGTAQVDHTRERIASDGRWTLVWQNGEELNVSGLALDHDVDASTGTWDITDGSAGLKGRVIKSDNLAELKLYVAALLSGAAGALTETQTTAFGTFALPNLQNAPLAGAQSVLQHYAEQIQNTIERDGFYVRVPAGKQFYLYVTQTLDKEDAKIGGSLAQAVQPPGAVAQHTPASVQTPPSTDAVHPPLRSLESFTPQSYYNLHETN